MKVVNDINPRYAGGQGRAPKARLKASTIAGVPEYLVVLFLKTLIEELGAVLMVVDLSLAI